MVSASPSPGPNLDVISSLPPELLLYIFSFVPTDDLLLNVAPLSKHFRQLAQAPDAHKVVTVSNESDLVGAAEFLKSRGWLVETLLLTGTKEKSGEKFWKATVPLLQNLKSIEVTGTWKLGPNLFDMIGEEPARAKKLVRIKVLIALGKREKISESGWSHPTALKYLEVNGENVGDYLCKIGRTSKLLERIKSDSIGGKSGDAMIAANSGTLKAIDLPKFVWPKDNFDAVASCVSVEELACNNEHLSNLRLVSSFANLRRLEIFSPGVNAMNVISAAAESHLPHLRSFSLRDAHIDDDLLMAAAKMTRLRELALFQSIKRSPADHWVSYVAFVTLYNSCSNLERLALSASIKKSGGTLTPMANPTIKYLMIDNGRRFLQVSKVISTVKESNLRCILDCFDDTLFIKPDFEVVELKKAFLGGEEYENFFTFQFVVC